MLCFHIISYRSQVLPVKRKQNKKNKWKQHKTITIKNLIMNVISRQNNHFLQSIFFHWNCLLYFFVLFPFTSLVVSSSATCSSSSYFLHSFLFCLLFKATVHKNSMKESKEIQIEHKIIAPQTNENLRQNTTDIFHVKIKWKRKTWSEIARKKNMECES